MPLTASRFSWLARFSLVSRATALFVGGTLAGCSSAPSPASGGDPSCAALITRCENLPGETTQTCQEMAQAASIETQAGTSCASLLQSYEASGVCGGAASGAASFEGGVPSVDGGTSGCQATGTCDAGDKGSAEECEIIGSCANGVTYSTCTEIGANGVCTASVVFSNGTQMACASCTDCAAASASASKLCGLGPNPIAEDAGPPPAVDAGPDCESSRLHPGDRGGRLLPFHGCGGRALCRGRAVLRSAVGDSSPPARPPGRLALSRARSPGSAKTPSTVRGPPPEPCAARRARRRSTRSARTTAARGSRAPSARLAAARGRSGDPQLGAAGCASPAVCTPFKVAGLVLGTCL